MLAERLNRIELSPTLRVSAKAKSMAAAGIDVIDLSVGEPDFPTPENVKDAARFGTTVHGEISLDFSQVATHRDSAVSNLVSGIKTLLKAGKIKVISGRAHLKGPGEVIVEKKGER